MGEIPEGVPADVWDATNQLVPGNVVAYTAESRRHYRALVARAIMAERERAASVAEAIGEAYGEDETGWLDCSETIAMAVRRGDPAPSASPSPAETME